MFKRHHIDFNDKTGKGSDQPGMRYLYCALTGARFARSPKARQTPHQPICTTSDGYTLLPPDSNPDTPTENESACLPADTGATPTGATPADVSPGQTIVRLTAERDAARYQCELEADYREALLRDLDMLSRKLEETQRRLKDLEQGAHSPGETPQPPGETPQPPGERERQLEYELEEARRRICQLESMAAPSPPAPLSRAQEGMMDVFLQFVGLQERHDDSPK